MVRPFTRGEFKEAWLVDDSAGINCHNNYGKCRVTKVDDYGVEVLGVFYTYLELVSLWKLTSGGPAGITT